MEVHKNNEEKKAKEQMYINYNLASNIVIFLGSALSNKPVPRFEDLYPTLNNKEATDNSWLIIKEKFKQYAEGFNQQHSTKDN